MVGAVSLVLVLRVLFVGGLGRPTRIFFVIKDRVFIIGRSRQLLILLVQEGHPVHCVARHCLVLVVVIDIDPAAVWLRRRDLLLGLLQGHIGLAFLDLVEELGPFFLALGLRLPVHVDPSSCSTSLVLADCIWGITLLTHWWRACLQDSYGVLRIWLAAAMHGS